jgi:hypothetical protein
MGISRCDFGFGIYDFGFIVGVTDPIEDDNFYRI